MSRIAVTGYASLDHVAILDGVPAAGVTTTILDRPAWPRLGGSPAYVAAALVAAGVKRVVPISWIGPDGAGSEYRRRLQQQHVSCEGIAIVPNTQTPVTILGYEPAGGCICLYDPGAHRDPALSDRQKQLLAEADWVCVTIGPAAVSEAVLETISPSGRLAWVVKHDPRALPPALAARLAARANVIFFSRAEGELVKFALATVGEDRQGCYLIETRGRSGVACTFGGRSLCESADAVDVLDPTGAGDTFAGGALAALVGGERDPSAILRAGQGAARQMLLARQPNESR